MHSRRRVSHHAVQGSKGEQEEQQEEEEEEGEEEEEEEEEEEGVQRCSRHIFPFFLPQHVAM